MSKKSNSLLIIALMLFSFFSPVIVSAVTVEGAVSGYYEVSYSDYNVTGISFQVTEDASQLTISMTGVDDGVVFDQNNLSTYVKNSNLIWASEFNNDSDTVIGNVLAEYNMSYTETSAVFNGNDSKIQITNPIQEGEINFSVFIGFNRTGLGGGDFGRLLCANTIINDFSVYPRNTNPSIISTWVNGTSPDTTSGIYTNEYSNIALEYLDGDRLEYDVNGAMGVAYDDYIAMMDITSLFVGAQSDNTRTFDGSIDYLYIYNTSGFSHDEKTAIRTHHTGTSAKLGENGEWQPVINGQVTFENVTAGETIYLLSAYPTTADTATFRYDYPTDDITLIEESISGNDVNINISYIPSNNYSVATINYTPSNYPMYFVDMDTTDANATFSYGIDGIIEILTSSLSSGVEYFYNFTASLYMDAPENLNATSDIDHVHLEWDAVSGADNYSVCIPLPAMYNLSFEGIAPPPNDGTFNQTIANFSQNGILRSPNPIDPLTVERIYAAHDENYVYMGANTYDNDANALDDRIGVYIDVLQDGLTTDDRGWQIREDGTLTYLRWSGTAWINAGVTGASAAVTGAGTTNPQYTLQIPKSELVGIADGNHIDLVVRRTNTDGATTYTFFPDSTGYTILTTDGWQDLYMSPYDTPEGLYCQYTTDNFFNATGLDSYSEYTFIVSGMWNGILGNSSYIRAVTLDYPTYSISGYVASDIAKYTILHDVLVVVTDTFTQAFATTDDSGYYEISGLHNDDYVLDFSKDGFTTYESDVTISDANVTNNNITMHYVTISESRSATSSNDWDMISTFIWIALFVCSLAILFKVFGSGAFVMPSFDIIIKMIWITIIVSIVLVFIVWLGDSI